FFATDRDQDTHPSAQVHRQLSSWVWRTFFSRRYSKRLEQLNQYVSEIKKIREGTESTLGHFPVTVEAEFFIKSQFNLSTANTKTFILMLASENPLNFTNGAQVFVQEV